MPASCHGGWLFIIAKEMIPVGINIKKFDIRIIKEKGGRYDLDKKLTTPFSAVKVFVEVLELDKRTEELFAMITLDVKNQITGIFEVSKGGLHQSIVHPRNIFQRAILQNAAAVILAHNHPSTDTTASKEDIRITKKLMAAGEILGIEILDHLIIGDENKFSSMKERDLI